MVSEEGSEGTHECLSIKSGPCVPDPPESGGTSGEAMRSEGTWPRGDPSPERPGSLQTQLKLLYCQSNTFSHGPECSCMSVHRRQGADAGAPTRWTDMTRHRRKVGSPTWTSLFHMWPGRCWAQSSQDGWLRRWKCSVQTTTYNGEPAYQSSQPTHSTKRTGSKLYSKELVHSKSRA